ncbi:uncharacterized protein [Physcomitrium patens]|uniref:uncharacterized protein n=1 Tax=Physcomitrium patens TaxID=3218 RepID=UPI003CCDED53
MCGRWECGLAPHGFLVRERIPRDWSLCQKDEKGRGSASRGCILKIARSLILFPFAVCLFKGLNFLWQWEFGGILTRFFVVPVAQRKCSSYVHGRQPALTAEPSELGAVAVRPR